MAENLSADHTHAAQKAGVKERTMGTLLEFGVIVLVVFSVATVIALAMLHDYPEWRR